MNNCNTCGGYVSPGGPCPKCDTQKVPKRRFEFELHLGADSKEELLNRLEQILQDGEIEGFPPSRVHGGVNSGYWFEFTERPEVTPESYQAAIEANRAYRLKHGEALK